MFQNIKNSLRTALSKHAPAACDFIGAFIASALLGVATSWLSSDDEQDDEQDDAPLENPFKTTADTVAEQMNMFQNKHGI